jgi:hypothetical protein
MNAKNVGLSAIAIGLFLILSCPALAQGPMVGIEPIAAILPATPPDNVFERFYPNVFDPVHPKKFTFTGTVTNGSTSAPAFVDLWFDWIDPTMPTPPKTSPVFPIDVPPGGTVPIGLPGGPPPIMFTIPFCPQQVSIHIQNNGPGQPVVIEGTFIHECIPEPATATLGALATLSVATMVRRRRR